MRHYYGPSTVSTPKAALTMTDLGAIVPLVDLSSYVGARDWCAFLFAFFGLLRINEYASAGLRHRHVRLTDGGVDITILSSKTMQHPVTVSVAARPGDPLCPVSAYHGLIRIGHLQRVPQDADTPLFLSFLTADQGFEPTGAEEFTRHLRFLLSAAVPAADPARYAGHSFRRGGATAMLIAGVPPAVIQRHGRWQSDTWRQYIDTLDNPAARLVATRSLTSTAPTGTPPSRAGWFGFTSTQTSPLAPHPPR